MKACYIHVPFCRDICAYCDFTRCRYHKGLADLWLTAIQQEIKKELHGEEQLFTIYIGGGTPSALQIKQLETLLDSISSYTKEVKEYTMEANVESFDADKIAMCRTYGINRISLGVQTLQPALLERIQRHHSKTDILRCIQAIHAGGIHNISIDLIYGLPGQTLAMWKADLHEVVKTFDIQHISLYALTIEKNSQFGREHVKNIDASIEADMYEYAIHFLQKHGFLHYEISSFAKAENFMSQHNMAYWRYDDFYGIGCGASGKKAHYRYDNTKNLQIYLEQGPTPDIINLNTEDEVFEMIMMGLRTSQGLNLAECYNRYQTDVMKKYHVSIRKHEANGLLKIEGKQMKATYRGMMLLNDIVMDFLPNDDKKDMDA